MFFGFLIVTTFLEAFGSAYLQNSVIAMSSWFGPHYLQGILSGQGAIGAIVSLQQLLACLREFETEPGHDFSQLVNQTSVAHRLHQSISSREVHITQDKTRNSSYTFYIAGSASCVFALLSFTILCNLPFYKLVIKRNHRKAGGKTPSDLQQSEYYTEGSYHVTDDGPLNPLLNTRTSHESSLSPLAPPMITNASLITVEPKIRALGMSVFWVFFITLAVYPSVTGSIISVHPSRSGIDSGLWSNWNHPLIFISLHFLCFNFGDWFGRVIPQLWSQFSNRLIAQPRILAILSLARITFVPLFLLCNVEHSSIVVFGNDLGT